MSFKLLYDGQDVDAAVLWRTDFDRPVSEPRSLVVNKVGSTRKSSFACDWAWLINWALRPIVEILRYFDSNIFSKVLSVTTTSSITRVPCQTTHLISASMDAESFFFSNILSKMDFKFESWEFSFIIWTFTFCDKFAFARRKSVSDIISSDILWSFMRATVDSFKLIILLYELSSDSNFSAIFLKTGSFGSILFEAFAFMLLSSCGLILIVIKREPACRLVMIAAT